MRLAFLCGYRADKQTFGRYARIIRMDDLYCTLQADSYKYDVPLANIRKLTTKELGKP